MNSKNLDRNPPRKTKRFSWLRSHTIGACCAIALAVGTPTLARAAADNSQDLEDTDARLAGYNQNVKMEKSGVALTWMLFLALSVVGCSVMFKNPKRSHLD